MKKGEKIQAFVESMGGGSAHDPCYEGYFVCFNDQKYYEAHDVLEQLWLNNDTADGNFFKGLIQAAGAFVHLQRNFEHPTHAKHSRRLRPAVKLFELSEKNLSAFAPRYHALDVSALLDLLRATREKIVASDFKTNPWSPKNAPKLQLSARKN